jgi:hypothetical protein
MRPISPIGIRKALKKLIWSIIMVNKHQLKYLSIDPSACVSGRQVPLKVSIITVLPASNGVLFHKYFQNLNNTK